MRSILKNRFVYLCSGNTLRQLEVNLKIFIITCNHFLTSFAVIHLFIWSNNFMIVSGGSLIDHVPIITCYRTVIIPTVPHNLRFPRTITTATTTSKQTRVNVPCLQYMLFTMYLKNPLKLSRLIREIFAISGANTVRTIGKLYSLSGQFLPVHVAWQ